VWAARIAELVRSAPRLLATSVFELMKAEGYGGSYVSVARHLFELRGPRFAASPTASTRIVTAPGEECQFDWSDVSHWTKEWGLGEIQCFSAILSWSRVRIWWYSRSIDREYIRVQGKKINAHWFRQFIDYDPVPIFEQLKIPVLAIVGSNDMQIPPTDIETIKHLVKGPCDTEVIADVSHLLRDDPDKKGPRDYKNAVKQPVSSMVLATIVKWIDRQLPADR
jgi:pimeloyl-ACP methyl ester carboxylesterase